jgi:hypothetical protein
MTGKAIINKKDKIIFLKNNQLCLRHQFFQFIFLLVKFSIEFQPNLCFLA